MLRTLLSSVEVKNDSYGSGDYDDDTNYYWLYIVCTESP
jgi:hypothetical protein